MNIYLIEAFDELLSTMSDKASSKTLKYLEDLNVKVLLNESVTNYDGNRVTTKSGKVILAKNLVWTAGVKGQFPKGIDKKYVVRGNRIKTDSFLRVEGYENIFAIGDIAAVINENNPKGHPQVAQTAIQQGKYLGKVLLKIMNNESVRPFEYKDKGSLATVGKRRAVADLGNFKFGGYFAWLLWSIVHLMSISGFRNRLMVGFNWAVSYFTYEKSNRLIIRNFSKASNSKSIANSPTAVKNASVND